MPKKKPGKAPGMFTPIASSGVDAANGNSELNLCLDVA